MRKELQDRLFAAHPSIFPRSGGDTPLRDCRIQTGDGWFDLLMGLCEKLETLPVVPVATQVKSKFGTLRFYTVDITDDAVDAISEAEIASSKTCETCGRPAVARTVRSWMHTCCDSCYSSALSGKGCAP